MRHLPVRIIEGEGYGCAESITPGGARKQAKSLVIRDKVYSSPSEARRKLHIGVRKLQGMFRNGKARWK